MMNLTTNVTPLPMTKTIMLHDPNTNSDLTRRAITAPPAKRTSQLHAACHINSRASNTTAMSLAFHTALLISVRGLTYHRSTGHHLDLESLAQTRLAQGCLAASSKRQVPLIPQLLGLPSGCQYAYEVLVGVCACATMVLWEVCQARIHN